MEQVRQTTDYYCKHCSAPLIYARPSYSEAVNAITYKDNLDEKSIRLDEIESKVINYLKLAGITDHTQINDVIQRVIAQQKSIMRNVNEHELTQNIINSSYFLLSSEIYKANATPTEMPTTMQTQNLEYWSVHPIHYLQSLTSIFTSLLTLLVKRR